MTSPNKLTLSIMVLENYNWARVRVEMMVNIKALVLWRYLIYFPGRIHFFCGMGSFDSVQLYVHLSVIVIAHRHLSSAEVIALYVNIVFCSSAYSLMSKTSP